MGIQGLATCPTYYNFLVLTYDALSRRDLRELKRFNQIMTEAFEKKEKGCGQILMID